MESLIVNISNSFFGVLDDSLHKNSQETKDDEFIRVLLKENRHMYLILLFIFILMVITMSYSPPSTPPLLSSLNPIT
jgi:hypothetical protein